MVTNSRAYRMIHSSSALWGKVEGKCETGKWLFPSQSLHVCVRQNCVMYQGKRHNPKEAWQDLVWAIIIIIIMLSFRYKKKDIDSVIRIWRTRATQSFGDFFPIYKLPAMKHLTNKHQLFGSQFQFIVISTDPAGRAGCQNTRFHYKVSIFFKARDFRIMFQSLLVGGVDIRHPK